MTWISPEDLKKRYMNALGLKAGALFYDLFDEAVAAHGVWQEYRKLFAKSKARVDLLNEIAPHLFATIQWAMYDVVILHVCRLTDPPRHGPHEHLTLLQLPEALADDAALLAELRARIEIARQRADPLREYRNSQLAHRELAHFVSDTPQLLPSYEQTEAALGAIRGVMNHIVDIRMPGDTLAFDDIVAGPGDAGDLTWWLRIAKHFEGVYRGHVSRGTIPPEYQRFVLDPENLDAE